MTLLAALLLTVIKRKTKKRSQVGPLPMTTRGKSVDECHPDNNTETNNPGTQKNNNNVRRGDMITQFCIPFATCV